MYKKMLKMLKKTEGGNSIRRKQAHFIFSAENPKFDTKLKMNHEETMSFLKNKGYHTEEANGRYGDKEKSIVVHTPRRESISHLHKLASNLGQESSIYSNGYNHEMHFHHGEMAGKHFKGKGTRFHHSPPDDNYTSMEDGSHFTHNFDLDTAHEADSSIAATPMKKSEDEVGVEEPMTLHHYSDKSGLKSIKPSSQGTGFDSHTKGRDLEHKISFFYPSHVSKEDISKTPDSHVAEARHKYTVKLNPEHKIYNASTDKHKYADATRSSNNGVFNMDNFIHHLKSAGYHGMLIDKHPTLKPMVGMFYPTDVHSKELSKSEGSIYDQRYRAKDKVKDTKKKLSAQAAKSYDRFKKNMNPKRRNSKHPLVDGMIRKFRRKNV